MGGACRLKAPETIPDPLQRELMRKVRNTLDLRRRVETLPTLTLLDRSSEAAPKGLVSEPEPAQVLLSLFLLTVSIKDLYNSVCSEHILDALLLVIISALPKIHFADDTPEPPRLHKGPKTRREPSRMTLWR